MSMNAWERDHEARWERHFDDAVHDEPSMTVDESAPSDEPKTTVTLKVSVSSDLVYAWATQAPQYPPDGPPGISYFRGDVSPDVWVDCLLWRDEDGTLRGILNRYPTDIPPWEAQGNFNLWVDPDWHRQGIGTALITEADRRWSLDFEQQRYTLEGAALVARYLERQGRA
jgi:GNAT superfamily N-acetyltransferase